jgi:hypothetical protein
MKIFYSYLSSFGYKEVLAIKEFMPDIIPLFTNDAFIQRQKEKVFGFMLLQYITQTVYRVTPTKIKFNQYGKPYYEDKIIFLSRYCIIRELSG